MSISETTHPYITHRLCARFFPSECLPLPECFVRRFRRVTLRGTKHSDGRASGAEGGSCLVTLLMLAPALVPSGWANTAMRNSSSCHPASTTSAPTGPRPIRSRCDSYRCSSGTHLGHPPTVAREILGESFEAVLDAAHVPQHVGQSGQTRTLDEAGADEPVHVGAGVCDRRPERVGDELVEATPDRGGDHEDLADLPQRRRRERTGPLLDPTLPGGVRDLVPRQLAGQRGGDRPPRPCTRRPARPAWTRSPRSPAAPRSRAGARRRASTAPP